MPELDLNLLIALDALLVRAGRGLAPTPRAAELRQRARDLALEARALPQPGGAELDVSALKRAFAIRANQSFVEALAGRIVAAATAAAPGVRLRFAPKFAFVSGRLAPIAAGPGPCGGLRKRRRCGRRAFGGHCQERRRRSTNLDGRRPQGARCRTSRLDPSSRNLRRRHKADLTAHRSRNCRRNMRRLCRS